MTQWEQTAVHRLSLRLSKCQFIEHNYVNTCNVQVIQTSDEQIRLQVPAKLFGDNSWIPQMIKKWALCCANQGVTIMSCLPLWYSLQNFVSVMEFPCTCTPANLAAPCNTNNMTQVETKTCKNILVPKTKSKTTGSLVRTTHMMCLWLCTAPVPAQYLHTTRNTAWNSSDSLSSYPTDN